MLLPGTSPDQAAPIAGRVRAAVDNRSLAMPARSPKSALNAGVAVLPLDRALRLVQLLERADATLCQAKAEGRNRVVVWQPGSVRLREIAESV